MSSAVRKEQRFTPERPCPICGGHEKNARGSGQRCFGFLSEDGSWAHCTREDYAGPIPQNNAGAFAHKLGGPCKCGVEHMQAPQSDYVPKRARSERASGEEKPPWERIVEAYDYTDESGTLLYQNVRLEDPKDFRQRQPKERGGWSWSVNGTRRVLYALPKLLEAPSGSTVLYVEGERDQGRAEAEGFLATTHSAGAKSFRPEYADAFEGQHVVVIFDNDKDGHAGAEKVAEGVYGKAASVKVVELPGLPTGGDLSDYFDRGHTAEDLRCLYESTDPYIPTNSTNRTNSANRANPVSISAAYLVDLELPATRWIVPDVLPEGVTLLVGKPKKGKSWLALGLCEAIAAGGVALGSKRVEQGDTLYLALEDNTRRLQTRLKKVLDGRPAPERMHVSTEWPRLDEGGAEALADWLTEHTDTRLVVIDTLAKIRKPTGGQNVYTEDYAALEVLLPIAARHGVSIVVVHHLRKMAASDPMDEISSSTGLTAGVDGFMILRRTPGSNGPTLYVEGRDVEDPKEYALHWNMNTATWTIEGDAEEVHMSDERGKILLTLNRSPEPMTPKEVSDMLPGSKYNNVKYLMWKMLEDEQLLKNQKGKYSPAKPTNPPNPPNPPNPTNSPNRTNRSNEDQDELAGLATTNRSTNRHNDDRYRENGRSVSGVSGEWEMEFPDNPGDEAMEL